MDPLFGRRFLLLFGSVVVCGTALLGFIFHERITARRQYAAEVRLAVESAELLRDSVVVYSELTVRPGLTFSDALERMEIEPEQAQEIIRSASGVFDLRQFRAGSQMDVGRSVEGKLQEVRYRIDGERMLAVRPSEAGFAATVEEIPTRTETIAVRGEIEDSLFAAVSKAGEGPELAMRLAEIFGWDLDFYTDPRTGDTFRVQVEKKTSLDGRSRTYGRVTYAEYVNEGHPYRALLYRDAAGRPAYFSPEGKSLQKAFLRSPLKFSASVSSGFSRGRFHPILQQRRAHLGVDYRAQTGTPVQAIGPGRVVFAGYRGGNGNMVHLRHSNGYETQYLHLSRILVRTGNRVESGDRIGLVGATGLATGPHLHFNFMQGGVHRNFEVVRRNLPSAEPVAPADTAEFAALRENVMAQLEGADSLATRAATGLATGSGLYLQPGQKKDPPLQPAALR